MLDPPPDDFRLLRFNTNEWPRQLGFGIWHDLLRRKLLDVEAEALETPFQAEAFVRVLETVRFGWGTFDASSYLRETENVARDNDDFVLFVNFAGRFRAAQRGREIELRPGEAYVMACSETGSYERSTRGQLLTVRVPGGPLLAAVPNVYDRVACVLPRGAEPLRLICGYVRSLDNSVGLTNPVARSLVASHATDLMALALGATQEATVEAEARGLQVARLESAKAIVEHNLRRPGFNIGELAARHGLTKRQVQRLFAAQGITFSQFLLSRRLQNAYRLLCEPRNGGMPIKRIAALSGFNEISYFNRAFLRRFGTTPGEVRRTRPVWSDAEPNVQPKFTTDHQVWRDLP